MKKLEESSSTKIVIAIKNSNKEIGEVLDNFGLIINQLLDWNII